MRFVHAVAFAAALGLTSAAQAQTVAPDAASTSETAKPKKKKKVPATTRFETRTAQMKADIKALPEETTGTIVMVGDSITEGFFNQKQMPEKIHGVLVVNQGISGDQIDRPTSGTGVTHRLDLVRQAKPAVVCVMIGVNDFWGGKETVEEVLPQYEKMFAGLKQAAPNAKFVWQSVLPTSMKNAYLNPSVNRLNARIKELAAQAGDTYLDLHPIMTDANGELKAEYTNDGVHLNPEAYQAWLKELTSTLQPLLQ